MADRLVPINDLPDSAAGQEVPLDDLPDALPAQRTRPRNSFQGMGLSDIQAAYQKARQAGADYQTLASIADAYVAREQQEGGFGLALDDTIRGLARGTLGIGEGLDEASAYLNTLGGLTGDYQENLDYQRARDRYLDNSAPVLSTGLKVAGGVASAIAAAPRLGIGTAQTLGQNVLRSGIAGTAGGAGTGFLAGEGGVSNRAAKAAVGGVVGGTLGVAVPVAAAGLSGTGRLIQSRLAPGTVNAERRAGEVLGQAMTRSDMRPGNVSSFGDMQAKGINNATLADLSDELTSLTGAVARSPGRGRQIVGDFLRTRQLGDPKLAQAGGGQWADIFDDITELVSKSGSAKRAGQAIVARRAEEAEPLYRRAFEVGNVVSDELSTLGRIPAMKTALQRGVNMAMQKRQLAPNFKLNLAEPLPIQVWHQAKVGIDDMIGAAMREGKKAQADSLLTMQRALLDELDNVTGGLYGQARNNFAGNSAVLNALEQGKKVLDNKMGAEDIADYVATLTSQSERNAFRAGVAQTMRDTVGRVGRKSDSADKFLNRGDIQMKLQAVFDDPQDYQAFMARMEGRSRMFRTYSELTGSATQPRQVAGKDLDATIEGGVPAENIIAAAATGGRGGVVRSLMQRLEDGPVSLLNERTKAKLAEMLTTNDPQQIQRVMDVVEAAYRRAREGTARNAAVQTGLIQSGVVQPVVSQ
jgi:hypothetical protein